VTKIKNGLAPRPRKGGEDLPSPAIVGNVMVVSAMSGIATATDASMAMNWKDGWAELFRFTPLSRRD